MVKFTYLMAQRAVFVHTRLQTVRSCRTTSGAGGVAVIPLKLGPLPCGGLAGAHSASPSQRGRRPPRDTRRLDTDASAVSPSSGRSAEVVEGRQLSGGAQSLEAGGHCSQGAVPLSHLVGFSDALLHEVGEAAEVFTRLHLQLLAVCSTSLPAGVKRGFTGTSGIIGG